MANRKEYEMLFSLNAQLGNSYTGTFTKAQQQLVSMQQELQALAKTQSDISAYEKQQGAVESTQKKLEILQQQYDNIKKEMAEAGEFSSALENRLLSKQQQIDKTSDSLETQNQKLNQMGGALREAGVDTNNLGKASTNLAEEIKALRAEQEAAAESAGSFGDAGAQAFQEIHQALAAAGVIVALRAIKKEFDDITKLTMQYESAMSVIGATTGATAAEMAVMDSTIRQVALDTGLFVNDVAKSARDLMEVGGNVELAMAQLESGTSLAMATGTDMGKTFDFLSAVMKTFKLEASETSRVTDSFAYTTVKTNLNLSQLAEAYVNVGGSAMNAGIDINELNALLVIMSEAGLKGGAAGTGLAGVLRNLSTPTEKAAEEIANLNIQLYDNNGASRDMFVIMQELEAELSTLTDEQRKRSESIIFDNVSQKTWNMISAEGIQSAIAMSQEISGASGAFGGLGQAAGMAAVATDNTERKLREMEAASAELKLVIGEQLTPALGEVYSVSTKLIGGVTGYLQKNPELIRAATAFIGVLSAAFAAITTYTVGVRLLTAAKTALGIASWAALGPIAAVVGVVALAAAGIAALAGRTKEAENEINLLSATSRDQYYELQQLEREYTAVCAAMGETSAEAQLLKREFDQASAAFEHNKITAEDLAQAHREVMDSYAEMSSAQAARLDGVNKEGVSTLELVNRLDQLVGAEGKTAAAKQQILALVTMLNEAMPELSLAYDEYSDSLNTSAQSVRNLAEADLERERNAANYDSMLERMRSSEGLRVAFETAREELRLLQAEYDEMLEFSIAHMDDPTSESGLAYIESLRNELKYYYDIDGMTARVREAEAAYHDNEAAIGALSEGMAEYQQSLLDANSAQEEMLSSQEELQEVIAGVKGKVDELVEAYTAAYDAALKSVGGQYDIWDEAAKVVATSAATINTGIQSQITYWQNYNENLSNLSDRTADIDGLREMISSFADGSADSVNAIAGMAAATDTDLAAMVASWQILQAKQEEVATSLAELGTDFSTLMNALQDEMGETVQELNFSDEAFQSARETILGYIDGIDNMLPAVQVAYNRIAASGLRGLSGYYNGAYSGSYYVDGSHAGGLDYVPYDGYLAELHMGERVMTAEENRIVSAAPELMAVLAAYSGDGGQPTELSFSRASSGSGDSVHISFGDVVFHIDAEVAVNRESMQMIISEAGDDLMDFVFDRFEEHSIDVERLRHR